MPPRMLGNIHAFVDLLPTGLEVGQSSGVNASHKLLPGYPDITMDESQVLSEFLQKDLQCQELDQLSDRLWMMTEQRSANISQLSRQGVKGRRLIVTEEPKLHLIWFYDRIYVKPLPKYLLSRDFWLHIYNNSCFPGSNDLIVRSAALGFIRSYAHLIEFESDFRIAKCNSLSLIPQFVTWSQWRLLRSKLLSIRDEEVSDRFRFGEIRLTRLNFYSQLLLRKPYYHRTYRQYGEYFASFYPPLLFMFGIVSVLLGAMQLEATVDQYDGNWHDLVGLYRVSGAIVMVFTTILLMSLVTIFLYKVTNEWIFAYHCRYGKLERIQKKQSKP